MTDKAPATPPSTPTAATPAPPAVPVAAPPTVPAQVAAAGGGTPPATPAAPRAAAPAPAPKARTSPAAGFAIFLALVALLVAVAAGGLGAYALKEARDAQQNAAPAPLSSDGAPTSPQPSTAPSSGGPSPAPSASTSTRPAVSYVVDLERIAVKIPGPSGCNAAYVDVDTIANVASTGHEFYLSTCLDATKPELRIDRTSGRSTSGANPTAESCAALVSGTSGSTELVLQASPGLTFCLLTNKADATAQTLPQRLAAVEVLNVNAVDHSVTVAISTWHVG